MADKKLSGKKFAIAATQGFEESELFKPLEALKEAGASVDIVSIKKEDIKGWKGKDWGKSIEATLSFSDVTAEDYDGLMLPGGVMNADTLRGDTAAVDFVSEFVNMGKPIAVICHGAWILIEADGVHGRNMTSYHTIKTDLQNAGAIWVDREVVTDNGLVSSRKPDDIPAFNKKMIEEFAEGKHSPKAAADEDHDMDADALQVRH